MEKEQQERLKEAVERKARDAEAASHAAPRHGAPDEDAAVRGDQDSLRSPGRSQDAFSTRDKNSGHGKKTADKWNQ
jgi:hypothetical protein